MDTIWTSRYLAKGFAQDNIEVHLLSVTGDSLTCEFSVIPGPDGPSPFHLSTVSAHRVVAQCAINFICQATGIAKEALGEVWELNHCADYRRKIQRSVHLRATLRLVSRGWTKHLSTWLFEFDIEQGAFYGTMELAPESPITPTEGLLVHDVSEVDAYLDHYLSFYDGYEASARADPGVYKPQACVSFRPSPALGSQLRMLAMETATCLEKLYHSFTNENTFLPIGASISGRVARSRRPLLPTMIRLDVVETAEGCKIVEINSGNCGGIETYYRMYSFLKQRLFPAASPIPHLLQLLVDILRPAKDRGAVFAFLDDGQSKYLSVARRGILNRIAPEMDIEVCHFGDLIEKWTKADPGAFLYRDFIYEELDLSTDLGRRGEDLLLKLESNRYFASLCDEFLSDKSFIAEVDQLVRKGFGNQVGFDERDGNAWMHWMAPTTTADRVLHHKSAIGFHTPNGIVLKPADGYGGDSVTILPVPALPINASFYGKRSWVIQPFYETPTYQVNRKGRTEEKVHLVHGVFLLPNNGHLEYGGTFTRLSPDPVVNIGNDGDVVLFCEPEWFTR